MRFMRLLFSALLLGVFCFINTAHAETDDGALLDDITSDELAILEVESGASGQSLQAISAITDPVERCRYYINQFRSVCGPTPKHNVAVCTTVYKLMTDWCNKAVGIE